MKTSPSLCYVIRSLWRGDSLARIYLNWETRDHELRGRVLDIGAGRTLEYHEMPKVAGSSVEGIDQKRDGLEGSVDLEKDTMPYSNGSFDMVLMYNILEHIYNHAHLLVEARRVLKTDGELVGFVPFLVRYHPDPNDYFRYTGEALTRLLVENGFTRIVIKPLGGALFMAQFHMMSQNTPRIVRIPLYLLYRLLDELFLHWRPRSNEQYPVGYFFTAKLEP